MPIDYHVHVVGHGDREHTKKEIIPFLEKAVEVGLKEIGFADHDFYLANLTFQHYKDLIEYFPQLKVRVGLEVDYYPDQENYLGDLLKSYEYDYVIGSVHNIGDWNFDHPDYIDEYRNWDPEVLYEEYFYILAKSINSGLFNITGHLDLIKVFNYRIEAGRLLSMVEPLLDLIKGRGMAVEINTNGLFKPVAELYPSLDIIKLAVEKKVPLTISSDAHRAEDVGRKNSMVVQLLRELGVTWVAGFSGKTMYQVKI